MGRNPSSPVQNISCTFQITDMSILRIAAFLCSHADHVSSRRSDWLELSIGGELLNSCRVIDVASGHEAKETEQVIFGQFRFLLVFMTSLVLAPSALADRTEVVFWESIASSLDGEEYCAYLSAYPQGKFKALAQLRAKKFGGSCAVSGTIGSQSISPARSVDKAKKTESFFASDNYFDGKIAFDAKNYKKAIQLWSASAEQGHPEAQFLVGSMYNAGYGVTKNHEKAMDWFRKAAHKGDALAQFGIGNLYGDGLGVEKDYVMARMWFAISANGGNDRAEYNLNKISQRMSADEIAKSEKMALDWMRKNNQL